MPIIKTAEIAAGSPVLAQVQIQEPKRNRTGLSVNFSPEEWARLQAIQATIARDKLIPEPSIHALVLKAVGNYMAEFEAKQGEIK